MCITHCKITWFVTQFNIFLASILQQASQTFPESSLSLYYWLYSPKFIFWRHTPKCICIWRRGSQKVLSLKSVEVKMMAPNSIRLMSSMKEKLQSYLIFLAPHFINVESSHMKARKKNPSKKLNPQAAWLWTTLQKSEK